MVRSITLELPPEGAEERRRHWERALPDQPVAELTERFLLGAAHLRRAATEAVAIAALDRRDEVISADVRQACRSLNRQRLETLATHLEPAGTWDALVVTERTAARLYELERRCRHRERVLARLAPLAARRGHARRARAVHRPQRHRQDAGRADARRRARHGPLPRRPRGRRQQVHRRDREEPAPGVLPRRGARRRCCCSTRATRCSTRAPRSVAPTTATRTSRRTTCCSAWSPSGHPRRHHQRGRPDRQRVRAPHGRGRRLRRARGRERREIWALHLPAGHAVDVDAARRGRAALRADRRADPQRGAARDAARARSGRRPSATADVERAVGASTARPAPSRPWTATGDRTRARPRSRSWRRSHGLREDRQAQEEGRARVLLRRRRAAVGEPREEGRGPARPRARWPPARRSPRCRA